VTFVLKTGVYKRKGNTRNSYEDPEDMRLRGTIIKADLKEISLQEGGDKSGKGKKQRRGGGGVCLGK